MRLTLSEQCHRALPKYKMFKCVGSLHVKEGIKHGYGSVLTIFSCVHMYHNRIKIQCDLIAKKSHKEKYNSVSEQVSF